VQYYFYENKRIKSWSSVKEKAFHTDQCWMGTEGTSWKRSLNILAKFKSSCDFPDGFRIIIKAQKETSVFASG